MRTLLLFLLVFYAVKGSYGQSLSERDISILAEDIEAEKQGIIFFDGIEFKGCISKKRTLIYQYNISEDGALDENAVDNATQYIKDIGEGDFFYRNNIDLEFQYYKKDSLLHKFAVNSEDLAPQKYELGEYLSIKGHPKSKQVNLKIKSPVAWRVKEGDLPNIVKQFVMDGNTYAISIRDNITFFSRRQTMELFEDSGDVEFMILDSYAGLENVEIIDYSITTIDSYPAIISKVKGTMKFIGRDLTMITISWLVFYEDKIVILSGTGAIGRIFNKLESLYWRITNSVVFPDQYK